MGSIAASLIWQMFKKWGCAQDGKAEAQVQIDALESAKRKLERKLSALAAKSSALKEANAAQAVTLEGLQVKLASSSELL